MLSYLVGASILAANVTAGNTTPTKPPINYYKMSGAEWPGLCTTGKKQSPINILNDVEKNEVVKIMGYNYKDFRLFSKTGLGFPEPQPINFANAPDKKINFPPCGDDKASCARLQITSSDKTKTIYDAMSINFHAPSEHTIDGLQWDLELHFIHEYQAVEKPKTYAILAFFFEVQVKPSAAIEENVFLNSVFDAIASSDKPVPAEGEDDANLLGIDEFFKSRELTEYYVYEGSLTYPPCTEGVTWNIFKQINKIHPDQLKKFTDRLAGDKAFAGGSKGNNREIQAITDIVVFSNKNTAANPLVVLAASAIATLAALSF